jgi:hypothetical protein
MQSCTITPVSPKPRSPPWCVHIGFPSVSLLLHLELNSSLLPRISHWPYTWRQHLPQEETLATPNLTSASYIHTYEHLQFSTWASTP